MSHFGTQDPRETRVPEGQLPREKRRRASSRTTGVVTFRILNKMVSLLYSAYHAFIPPQRNTCCPVFVFVRLAKDLD